MTWELPHRFEQTPLVPLSRQLGFFYVEYARVKKHQQAIAIAQSKEEKGMFFTVPPASIAALLMGPGCSITTEAIRVLAAKNCLLFAVGGSGTPMYMASSQHRSPLSKIRQMKLIFDEEKRLEAAHTLLRQRSILISRSTADLPPLEDISASSIEACLGVEGAWSKRAYRRLAAKYGSQWKGRASEDSKSPLLLLNHLSYSIADIVIMHRGLDPNLGILHGRTKGGGFCYDLADVIKPIAALDLSFQMYSRDASTSEIKQNFFEVVRSEKLIEFLNGTIDKLFAGGTKVACDS